MGKHRSNLLKRIRVLFPDVTSVQDAVAPVQVTIRATDRNKGKRGAFSECPLARACKRQFMLDGAMVGMTTSVLIAGNTATRYKTPETVRREITTFDRHGDFDLGQYHLGAIPKSLKIGYIRKMNLKNRSRTRGNHYEDSGRIRPSVHKTARVRRMHA